MIKFSCIIVSYNSGADLDECIGSLHEKNDIGDDLEILVSDNNSSDKKHLEALEKKYSFLRVLYGSDNPGFGAANNRAIRAARGDILFFCNPDITVNIISFRTIESRFSANPEIILGFGIFQPDGSFCKPFKFIPELDIFFPQSFYRYFHRHYNQEFSALPACFYISGAAFCIKKKLILEIGLFDEKFFMFYEENDLRMRLLHKKKYFPCIEPSVSVFHHEGHSYSMESVNWYADSFLRYCRKYRKPYLFFMLCLKMLAAGIIKAIMIKKNYELKLVSALIRRFFSFFNLFKKREFV
ncbi:MAG: hypothetical protein A2096_15985 [Spirochaetes bacterium GWF1_41_5]|nr:MAG: hypothetical protein A2096_15985 [Spirochaetes bacterium GWF1_41_5]HBE04125.1 hypothetical protein [Spirochaetia bacterium]